MSERRKLPRQLYGYAPEQVEHRLADQRQEYAGQIAALDNDLAAAQAKVTGLENRLKQEQQTAERLKAALSTLEAARARSEATLPLLVEAARRRIQELTIQAEHERRVAEEQTARQEQALRREEDEFLHILRRLKALAGTLGTAGPVRAAGPRVPDREAEAQRRGAQVPVRRVIPLWRIREPAAPVKADPSAGEAPSAGWRPGMVEFQATSPPPAAATPFEQAAATLAPPEPLPDETPASGAVPGSPAIQPGAEDPEIAEDPEVAEGIRTSLWALLRDKAVGADLRLPDGTLLARTGDPISIELAERARAAGVIADLILDMTFAPREA